MYDVGFLSLRFDLVLNDLCYGDCYVVINKKENCMLSYASFSFHLWTSCVFTAKMKLFLLMCQT